MAHWLRTTVSRDRSPTDKIIHLFNSAVLGGVTCVLSGATCVLLVPRVFFLVPRVFFLVPRVFFWCYVCSF